ncbi:MAG: ATP-binding protein [Candidatus Omnitrophota bacterium]
MIDLYTTEELIRKYRWAGKIRFLSFLLLLLFLFLMKYMGGYAYLDNVFITLICVEAILNQPYNFLIKRTNIHRFQYYQMTTDIIAITWIIHYMGGLEAPIISIAYYGIILWAGVVSTNAAVFFAVIVSAILFSAIVLMEHFGILPFISYYDYKIPFAQMFSLLLGNVSFLFAFGYFSAHSSDIIKYLQRKRQEETLRNVHKLLATGSLVGRTAHDVLNQLVCIKGYADVLLNDASLSDQVKVMLESIRRSERKGAGLIERLAMFSEKTDREFDAVDIHKVFEDALEVTWPLVRYTKVKIEKKYSLDLPKITANRAQLQETFVVFILNSMDAMSNQGKFIIETKYNKKDDSVETILSDTGAGIKQEDLKHLGKPFFTTKGSGKGLGIGLATAYGIVNRHNGNISVESKLGEGTVFRIKLPVRQPQQKQ